MSEPFETGINAMVNVHSQVPEHAMTAEILGTERSGHGIRIREDGLIATVGYLALEAEHIWIRRGKDRARRPISRNCWATCLLMYSDSAPE